MRLLRTGPFVTGDPATLELHDHGDRKVRYATLSHIWTSPQDEVLFNDLLACCDPTIRYREGHISVDLKTEEAASLTLKPGWAKLAFALEQADEDGKDWLWIDTACIDRTSSAELAAAINSRWDWLQGSAICYAFLGDVPLEAWRDMLRRKRLTTNWLTGGWTLADLIAPGHVVFYSLEWTRLGDKHELAKLLSDATRINVPILEGSRLFEDESIATRMSWAAHRTTASTEDRAYSLMGLFGVNMSILYGEGSKAFLRLQEEIMRVSDDHSLFAWKDSEIGERMHGLLADSPSAFAHSANYRSYAFEDLIPFEMSNRGIRISLHLDAAKEDEVVAALPCPDPATQDGYLAIRLRKLPFGDRQYVRIRCNEITPIEKRGEVEQIFVRQTIPPSIVSSLSMHSFNSNDAVQKHKPKESVLPTHLFHISRFRTWDGYKFIDVHYQPPKPSAKDFGDVLKDLKHPEHVPEHMSVTYKMVKADHRLTAVILVGRDDDEKRLAILLGSGEDCEPGFDIVECRDLASLRECYRPFEPAGFGTMIFGKRHRVVVRAEPIVRNAVKVYLIEVAVGALEKIPNFGSIDRVNSIRSTRTSTSSKRMSWLVQKVVRRQSQASQANGHVNGQANGHVNEQPNGHSNVIAT